LNFKHLIFAWTKKNVCSNSYFSSCVLISICSDHIYEAVNPPSLYESGLVGGDPETSSLDRHTFHIPPELDVRKLAFHPFLLGFLEVLFLFTFHQIVSSEGLDGLDQPDPHDFGMDGDKEWSLYYEDHKHGPSSPKSFLAGVRTPLPRLGETSSMRPLKQGGESPLLPNQNQNEGQQDASSPLEIREEEEEGIPREMEVEKETPLGPQASEKSSARWRFGKISLPIRPKFNQWTGIKLLKKKGTNGKKTKGSQQESDEAPQVEQDQPIPGPSAQASQAKLRIHFDDSLDLSLRPPSPKTKDTQGETGQFLSPPQLPIELVEEAENLEELGHQAKLAQERIREEAKRLKIEKLQREEEAKAELKRIKMEEKLEKEREKVEQKRLKEEEKGMKQKEEAELKRQKQLEQEEVKRQKQLEQEELKRKHMEQEAEIKLMKLLEQEELKRTMEAEKEEIALKRQIQKEEESEKVAIQQAAKQNEEKLKLDALEAQIMESICKEEETQNPPKPTKVELFKRKLEDIDLRKRFKRKTNQAPPRPSPPRFKFTQSPQNELAVQYRQEIQERMEAMEDDSHIAPEPTILITQPSVEFESETHAQWLPPRPIPAHEPNEDEDKEEEQEKTRKVERKPIGQQLKGLGQRSKSMAARTSKSFKNGVNVIGKKMSAKYAEAIKDMRAQEEARRLAQEEKEKRQNSESVPSTPKVFRFKRRPKNAAVQ